MLLRIAIWSLANKIGIWGIYIVIAVVVVAVIRFLLRSNSIIIIATIAIV
jgi:hypothetical protein